MFDHQDTEQQKVPFTKKWKQVLIPHNVWFSQSKEPEIKRQEMDGLNSLHVVNKFAAEIQRVMCNDFPKLSIGVSFWKDNLQLLIRSFKKREEFCRGNNVIYTRMHSPLSELEELKLIEKESREELNKTIKSSEEFISKLKVFIRFAEVI